MDKVDQKILQILSKDARARASEMSQQVNLSPSAVIDRMRRFEERGVIAGYTVQVNYNALGYGIRAWLHVQLEHARHAESFAAHMQHMPGLLSCDYLTGEFDFLLQAVVRNTQELDQLHRTISSIEHVTTVTTHVVLREIDCAAVI
ncbi:MAG: Lrp/AsnC family transcriptional regulator [Oscillospiraceae bacterium]|nr:Lrp/AsnC family transcriptional regulator [Oscillospiraceae bacterium]